MDCPYHGKMQVINGRDFCMDCEDLCPSCELHGGLDDEDAGGIKCRFCGAVWKSAIAAEDQEKPQ